MIQKVNNNLVEFILWKSDIYYKNSFILKDSHSHLKLHGESLKTLKENNKKDFNTADLAVK